MYIRTVISMRSAMRKTAICRSEVARQIVEALPMREVVEHYGFTPNRAGYISCPFHREKTASLKIYPGTGGWCCFGCHAGGSVINFVMRLFEIDFQQAVLRLSTDFGLNLAPGETSRLERSRILEARRREEARKAELDAEYRRKAAEYLYYWEARKYFAPLSPGDTLHPLFAEALLRLPELEYWLDENIGR